MLKYMCYVHTPMFYCNTTHATEAFKNCTTSPAFPTFAFAALLLLIVA